MKINKVTPGFMIQTWDTKTRKWVRQEFIAGDGTQYEEAGTSRIFDALEIWPDMPQPYLPFLMKQPDEILKSEIDNEPGLPHSEKSRRAFARR